MGVVDSMMVDSSVHEANIKLYHAVKKETQHRPKLLNADKDAIFKFYNKAKQLVNGTEDNELKFNCNEVAYFKSLRGGNILPIPLLFKYLSNNELIFRNVKISLQ